MLKKRIITALLLFISFVSLVFLSNTLVFTICLAVVYVYSSNEWFKLIGIKHTFHKIIYLFFLISLMFSFCLIDLSIVNKLNFVIYFITWFVIIISLYKFPNNRWGLNIPILVVLSLSIMITSWFSIVMLKKSFNEYYIIYLILFVSMVDTTSYFVGKGLGKTKIFPILSPKKTVAGCVGGLVFPVVLVVIIESFITNFDYSYLSLIYLVVTCFLFTSMAIVGDVFISMLKRNAKIKDSSQLLPGHGGILDRIDSVNASAPIFFMFLMQII